jgi:hypothetical protein
MTDSPWRCAGCGTPGRPSLADPDPADTRPVLRVSFSGAGGRPALLCPRCVAPPEGRDAPPLQPQGN